MTFLKILSKNKESLIKIEVLKLVVILREKLGMNSSIAEENERYYKNQEMISKIKKKVVDLSIHEKWLNSTNTHQKEPFSNIYKLDNMEELSGKLEKTCDSINLIMNNKQKLEPKLKNIISKISAIRNKREKVLGSKERSKKKVNLSNNSRININNISLEMKEHHILKEQGKKRFK